MGLLGAAFVLELVGFKPQRLGLRAAAVTTALWLLAGVAASVGIAALYQFEVLGAERSPGVHEVLPGGPRTIAELLEGFLVGKLLLFENLFVLYLVLKTMGVTADQRRLPLLVGVLGLQVSHLTVVAFEVVVVSFLGGLSYVLALYLVLAAIHLLPEEGEERTSFFVERLLARLKALLGRLVPGDRGAKEHHSRVFWTVVIVALLVVDVVFAFNMAPVMLGVSPEPLVVIAATGFSLAGARPLFELITHLEDRLWALRPYVAVCMILIAANMLFGDLIGVPDPFPLVVLGVVAGLGLWRVWSTRGPPTRDDAPPERP